MRKEVREVHELIMNIAGANVSDEQYYAVLALGLKRLNELGTTDEEYAEINEEINAARMGAAIAMAFAG